MNNIADPSPSLDAADVRRFYAALASGDLGVMIALLASDATLHVPGTQPLSGDHTGVDAILNFVLATTAATDSGERIELIDALADNDHVAGYVRVTAERGGRTALDNFTLHLFRHEGGRIVEIWFHNRDQAAVDAFWS